MSREHRVTRQPPTGRARPQVAGQSGRLRILIAARGALAEELAGELREQLDFVARRVETPDELLRELVALAPDVILAECSLPELPGAAAVTLAARHAPDVPVIAVADSEAESMGLECLRAGAADYLVAGRLRRAASAVTTAIELRHRRRLLAMTGRLTAEMTRGAQASRIIDTALRETAGRFPGFRAAYSTIDRDGRLRVSRAREPAGMPVLAGAGCELSAAPGYLEALRAGEVLVVDDVGRDRRLASLREPLALGATRAMIDVPVRHSAELVGLVCLDSPRPRRWRQNEAATLAALADSLAVALKCARAEDSATAPSSPCAATLRSCASCSSRCRLSSGPRIRGGVAAAPRAPRCSEAVSIRAPSPARGRRRVSRRDTPSRSTGAGSRLGWSRSRTAARPPAAWASPSRSPSATGASGRGRGCRPI